MKPSMWIDMFAGVAKFEISLYLYYYKYIALQKLLQPTNHQSTQSMGFIITAQGHASFLFAIAVAKALGLPLTDHLGCKNQIMLEDVKRGS